MEDLSGIIERFIDSEANTVPLTFMRLEGTLFRGVLDDKEISLDFASPPFQFRGFHPAFLPCMFEENADECLAEVTDVSEALETVHSLYVDAFLGGEEGGEGGEESDFEYDQDGEDYFEEEEDGVFFQPDEENKVREEDELLIGGSSVKVANKALMKDLSAIMAQDTAAMGFSIAPKQENYFVWEVRFFDFDDCELANDLKRHDQNYVELEMTFEQQYPATPPFIRVISPRFQFHTGHVTVGGSICMELLTNYGWNPVNTIE